MIKILIVEDDANKLRHVAAAILEAEGCAIDDIDDARDANAAKRLLREKHYDLLILDISIPARADLEPDRHGGVALLTELLERDLYNRPSHIIGLTGYSDSLQAATPLFFNEAISLVHYDAGSSAWADTLKRKVLHILQSSRSNEIAPVYDVDVAIITALSEPELGAVLDIPWAWQPLRRDGDGTLYHSGTATAKRRPLQVVAASAARMGMTAASSLAMKMIMTFRPRYIVMMGILAGVRGQCELGDVLIADPCWNYESGKHHVVEGLPAFAPAPHQVGLDAIVRGSIDAMLRDQSSLDGIKRGWRGISIPTSLSVRIGPVASGAAVLQNSDIVAEIQKQHRKTLGVEMEAYGVLVAAQEAPEPRPRALAIKSVCDFADEQKSDDFQRYAAYTSSSFLRRLVEDYLPF